MADGDKGTRGRADREFRRQAEADLAKRRKVLVGLMRFSLGIGVCGAALALALADGRPALAVAALLLPVGMNGPDVWRYRRDHRAFERGEYEFVRRDNARAARR